MATIQSRKRKKSSKSEALPVIYYHPKLLTKYSVEHWRKELKRKKLCDVLPIPSSGLATGSLVVVEELLPNSPSEAQVVTPKFIAALMKKETYDFADVNPEEFAPVSLQDPNLSSSSLMSESVSLPLNSSPHHPLSTALITRKESVGVDCESGNESDNNNASDPEENITEDLILPKYSAMAKHRRSDCRNVELCQHLLCIRDHWETLAALKLGKGTGDYKMRVVAVQRIVSIIRAWPVRLTSANYRRRERARLARQKYIGNKSHYLDDIGEMLDGWNEKSKTSAFGESTHFDRNVATLVSMYPILPFALEVRRMKWHIPTSIVKELFDNHNIRSVSELLSCWETATGRQILLSATGRLGDGGSSSIGDVTVKHLDLAREINMSTPLCHDEVYHKTDGIVTILAAHADHLGLELCVVGGARRGVLNAHDLDVVLRHKDGRNEIYDLETGKTALDSLEELLANYHIVVKENVTGSSCEYGSKSAHWHDTESSESGGTSDSSSSSSRSSSNHDSAFEGNSSQRDGLPFFVTNFGRSIADRESTTSAARNSKNSNLSRDAPAVNVATSIRDSIIEGSRDQDARYLDKIDKWSEHDVRHVCIRSPLLMRQRPAAVSTSSSSSSKATMRRLDLVLVPFDHWPFALWGWSGSTALMRQMRDYSKHARDQTPRSELADGEQPKPWHITGGKPIVGRRGWSEDLLTPGGRIIPNVPAIQRERHLAAPTDLGEEYWQVSQSGIRILFGSKNTTKRKDNKIVWVEDPAQFKTERDVFDFIHAEYLEPEERCA